MQSNDPTASTETQGEAPGAELEALKARVAELEAGNVELRDTVLREKAEIEISVAVCIAMWSRPAASPMKSC